MSRNYWVVWCPTCGRNRPTRIPADAPTTAVTAEYDAHMQRHRDEAAARGREAA